MSEKTIQKYRVWKPESNSMEYFNIGQGCEAGSNDIIMLGSGFIDNDGVEVFDRDIVIAAPCGYVLDKVIFANGCFCLASAIMHYESTYWGGEIKVVGNIYQNQELAEKL